MRRAAATLCAFLAASPLLGLGAPPRAVPGGDSTWLALETPAFRLVTDLDERSASVLAEQLDRLRSLLSELDARVADRDVDTRVFVLADRRQYLRFAPRPDGRPDDKVTGFFQTSIFGDRLVVDASGGRLPLETLFHEALHAWVRSNLPWTPLWLNEGLAEYYSTARFAEEHAVLGMPKASHLDWLGRESWMPLADLVAVGTTSELYHEGERRGSFYAESWGLVHYLLSSSDRRRRLGDYLVELALGADPNAAFERIFDRTYLALERDLEHYLSSPELPTLLVPSSPTTALPAPRPLPRTAVLVGLGELATRLGHLGDARSLFEEALRLSPGDGLARAGLGEVEDLQGNHGIASVWYEEAVAATPEASLPHYLLGEATLRRLLRQQRGGVEWSELDGRDLESARLHLRRSLALDPRHGAAHAALGQSWLITGDGPPTWGLTDAGRQEAIGALGRAAELLPGEPQVLLHSSLLLCRSGGCDRARELLASLRRFRRPELLLLHQEQLATTELELAGWLVNHGDHDRGQQIAERLDSELEPGLRGQLGSAIDEIVRVARHNRAVVTIERAIDLARGGDVASAIALLDRILQEDVEGGVARTARDLRRRLSR